MEVRSGVNRTMGKHGFCLQVHFMYET